jgi:hypothetical protein
MVIVMAIDVPISSIVSECLDSGRYLSDLWRMRGRKSKNSPVEGFVAVQSGSGSFLGLSVRVRRLDTTLSENRRNKTNIDRKDDIDTSILKNCGFLNDRWRGQKI